MLVSEATRRVQRIFGDTSEAQIQISDVLDWLNDGQLEVVRQTECLTGLSKYDTSIDTPTDGHVLPADFLLEKRVTYQDIPLVKTDILELDNLRLNPPPTATGSPYYYYLWTGSIWLWPFPAPLGVDYLKVWYVRQPIKLGSSNDSLEVPLQYQEDIIRYALMRAHELNDNDAAAQRVGADLQSRMALSRDEAQNPSDSYTVVRDYPGDWW